MQTKHDHLLILDPDRIFAQKLEKGLHRHGGFLVTAVPNVKEACLALMKQHFLLAFVPVSDGEKIIRSLRALQADLRIIIMTPEANMEIPTTYSGRVQGLLIKDLLNVELPALLKTSLSSPLVKEVAVDNQTPEWAALDTADVLSALSQAELGRLLLAVIFAQGNHIIGYWGELKEREATAIALYVGNGWGANPYPSRVQFFNLPARAGEFLLYTQQVNEAYLVTMVSLPEAPLNEVRHQTKRIVKKLEKVAAGKDFGVTGMLDQFKEAGARPSCALVWRPLRPVPRALHIPLRRAFERLAGANSCVLTHIDVHNEVIHLVVTCPPGRDTSWAAYLFKSGSQQIIQQEFGVAATLWETGFFARETADPLSTAELKLFLETEKR